MLETQKKSQQNTDNHQQNQKKRPRYSYLLSLRTLIPVLILNSSCLRNRGAKGGGIWESQEGANPRNRQRWDRASGAPGPAACGEEGGPAGTEVGVGVHMALPAHPVPQAAAVRALWHRKDKNSAGLQPSVCEGKTKPATLPFSPNQTLPFPYVQPFKGESSRCLLRGRWGSQWRAPRDLDPQHSSSCTSGSLGTMQTSVCSCKEQMKTC